MDPDAEIDHEGPVPVYQQLATILRARIGRGDWAPNRPIPSEAQLVQTYGIARETVRKGIRVLIDNGELVIVRGRGTFVADSSGPDTANP
ncbi:GntR family transcriptional regulator [Glycomyces xiaoerkulensis]|uniref:GntR family transcriptional regulator n=1 Tax=Glycomyces xiaoerkulensis TaxID=2038139 RepID=UPI000C268E14|nr:GntR family transcriptional regulator [Glycomyces xiaoerkulensis]